VLNASFFPPFKLTMFNDGSRPIPRPHYNNRRYSALGCKFGPPAAAVFVPVLKKFGATIVLPYPIHQI
jgi:hypothetical protein